MHADFICRPESEIVATTGFADDGVTVQATTAAVRTTIPAKTRIGPSIACPQLNPYSCV
jgi:hypothetical protein